MKKPTKYHDGVKKQPQPQHYLALVRKAEDAKDKKMVKHG
jgi:hypothetical protein